MLARMERDGVITRDVRGRRTYAISLPAGPQGRAGRRPDRSPGGEGQAGPAAPLGCGQDVPAAAAGWTGCEGALDRPIGRSGHSVIEAGRAGRTPPLDELFGPLGEELAALRRITDGLAGRLAALEAATTNGRAGPRRRG